MKLVEKIERDCCDSRKDLKVVEGCRIYGRIPDLKFCVHCGARWKYTSTRDAAGSSDYEYVKIEEFK